MLRICSFLNSTGVIGRRSSKITLSVNYFSLPNNGSSCLDLVAGVIFMAPDITMTIVGDRCRRAFETAFGGGNMTVLYLGQGLPSELLPRRNNSFTLAAPRTSAISTAAAVLTQMNWRLAAVLTVDVPTAGDLAALQRASALLPPVVLELDSRIDTPLGVCSDAMQQTILDALMLIKSRRTPVIVIDV